MTIIFYKENEITLNISHNIDVYFNFTHMHLGWRIGNILTDESSELVRRKIREDISSP